VGKRRCDLSDILMLRAVHRLNRFLKPDLVVFLGDLVNDGEGPAAMAELRRLRLLADRLDAPFLALPGNHDPQPARFHQAFPKAPPALDLDGVRLLSFLDAEEPGYNASRSATDLQRLRAEANRATDAALVSLQHVPLFPPGLHSCPYNYTNADEVIAASHAAGVSLVISGHYHHGIPLFEHDGIRYLTAPALCEAPFRFLVVEIDGDRVSAQEHALAMPEEFALVDTHVHTPLAYCGENLDIRQSIEIAQATGLAGTIFTEHSGHLRFDAAGYGRCAATGLAAAQPRLRRTETYFGLLQASGIPRSRWGMEIDAGWDGSGIVDPADEANVAFRIGAMHSMRSLNGPERHPEQAAEEFLHILPRFLANGYNALAHPFRVFRRGGVPTPPDVVEPTVRLLKEHNTAAEINFHTNEPSVEFVRLCLEQGVKLTFGSDAHNLYEVGEFYPHLNLLREAGFTGNPEEVLLPVLDR
jgi:histidinol phosphatase-like PHP family hydrolase/predicted phosphodiesterase